MRLRTVLVDKRKRDPRWIPRRNLLRLNMLSCFCRLNAWRDQQPHLAQDVLMKWRYGNLPGFLKPPFGILEPPDEGTPAGICHLRHDGQVLPDLFAQLLDRR